MRVVQQRQLPLHDSEIRAADHPDLSIRPGVPRDPVQRVVAVGTLLRERLVQALGVVAPPHILQHHRVAALDERQVGGGQVSAFTVRRANQDGGDAGLDVGDRGTR